MVFTKQTEEEVDDFENSILGDSFDGVWIEADDDRSPCAFPWHDFLAPCFARLKESDLATIEAWDMILGAVPTALLVDAVKTWRSGMDEEEFDALVRQGSRSRRGNGGLSSVLAQKNARASRLRQALLKILATESSIVGARTPSRWPEAQTYLCDSLQIDRIEADILALAFSISSFSGLSNYVEGLKGICAEFLSRFLGVDFAQFHARTHEHSRLSIIGVLSTSAYRGRFELEIESSWYLSLANLGIEEKARDSIVPATSKGLAIDSFGVAQKDMDLLLKLLASPRPMNILVFGEPGTGKTEFVRSLAQQAGIKPWILNPEIDTRHQGGDLIIARRFLRPGIDVLVVDEAEKHLGSMTFSFFGMSSESGAKATVNALLETQTGKTVWIVNNIDVLDDSSKRRFQHIFKMPKANKKTRASIWAYYAGKFGLDGEHYAVLWSELAADFDLVPSIIESSMSTVASVVDQKNPENVRKLLYKILQGHVQLGTTLSRNGERRLRPMLLDASNVRPSATEILDGIARWLEDETPRRAGLRLLFHGAPGTGKSAFARHIASHFDLEVQEHRASDLLSMYVSGSERNIRNAFVEASRDGVLLLIDEIDTFLMSRSKAQHSWEISQVNEFLTSLESYGGLFVGTTNAVARLDPAVMRRFNQKALFDFMLPTQARQLATQLFPQISLRAESAWAALPPIAAGDLACIAEGASPPRDWPALEAAIRLEVSLRPKDNAPIGFRD